LSATAALARRDRQFSVVWQTVVRGESIEALPNLRAGLMNVVSYPPGWYPDPSRVHELRYFDGQGWTDHVSDAGTASEDVLPPVPPGLRAWHPPYPIPATGAPQPRVDVPRVSMWVLAVLSLSVFWVNTIVFPLGLVFAIWCWRITAEPLKSLAGTRSPATTEMWSARILALVLAALSLLTVIRL
jgi:hypothetical protein